MKISTIMFCLLAAAMLLGPGAASAAQSINGGDLWRPGDYPKDDLPARLKAEVDKDVAAFEQKSQDNTFLAYTKALAQQNELFQKTEALYEALTAADQRLEPDYQPAGAPEVPSQCIEDDACRPCYEKGQDKLNSGRKGLEQLRAIYDYTHKFAKQGEEFMQGVGSMAGAPAALQAQVEVNKTEQALAGFDDAARAKRIEMTDRVNEGLHMLSQCEAQFYHTDDWYNRYGFIYYQFMLSHYGDIAPK